MFETFRNAWKITELRKKILFTLFIIFIYRIGSVLIPVPFLNAEVLSAILESNQGTFLSYMNTLSGGALSSATVFALSIQPYINASIIMQLLTYALPPLERLQKEGETGRKRLQKISDILTIVLALVQGYGYYLMMRNWGAVTYTQGAEGVFAAIVIVVSFVVGASIIVWLGNRINEKGIGNGISMILFAGIIARGPDAVEKLYKLVSTDMSMIFLALAVVLIFVLMIGFIVFMNESERRIPIQYAKRVVGRKQYGGQNAHIPIKVAMSGVMPIIFASSFMAIPSMLEMFWQPNLNPETQTGWDKFYAGFLDFFSYDNMWYGAVYFALIIGFNYFYVAMQYNPVEIANNLRQNNGGIPGIRPGKPTSDYIQKILSKITLVGAFFLGVIAIFPIIFENVLSMMKISGLSLSMGGTSILIIVSVALETVRILESQMVMRHHKGFLE